MTYEERMTIYNRIKKQIANEAKTPKEYEVIGNIYDNPELLRPSLKPEYRDGDPDCPICPNCRTPLREMEDCDCGQKIDWSDTE